jgi:hypothetical protein
MSLWDIAGYTYNADEYCPEHVLEVMGTGYDVALSTEMNLDQIARDQGIDREDEYSYDSGDFPKLIFVDQCDNDDQCGFCGRKLG